MSLQAALLLFACLWDPPCRNLEEKNSQSPHLGLRKRGNRMRKYRLRVSLGEKVSNNKSKLRVFRRAGWRE